VEGVSGVCMELVHVPDMAQKSRNKFLKRLIFSTEWSQSMLLQSVLKIRCKTSKLFALHASPCKGSKPRVYLDPFVFSTRYRWRFSDSTDHTSDFWVLYLLQLYSIQTLKIGANDRSATACCCSCIMISGTTAGRGGVHPVQPHLSSWCNMLLLNLVLPVGPPKCSTILQGIKVLPVLV
jgi:hypothetical protein